MIFKPFPEDPSETIKLNESYKFSQNQVTLTVPAIFVFQAAIRFRLKLEPEIAETLGLWEMINAP